MPMVYLECPVTGYLVATNHILPDELKLKQPINRHTEIECPYCSNIHIWTDRNGFFLGSTDLKKK